MRFDPARSALLLALALGAGPTWASPSREDAEACAQIIERDEPVAQQDTRCLAVAEGFKAQFGAGNLKMSAEALRDWAMILPTTAPARPRAAPDPAALESVLAHLEQEQASAPRSLWDRFRSWIHSLLDPREERGRAPDWLVRLLESLEKIPHSAVKATFWSCVVILAASLLWVVVIELRANGLLGRSAKRAPTSGSPLTAGEDTAIEASALSLDDIAKLPAAARAPELLRWLLRSLAERRVLTNDRTLTHRELANRLPPGLAVGFRRFVVGIEPALFGGQQLESETFAWARALASELAASAARGAGTP